eukprot:SAG31_NODE_568_length_14006_cov_4.252119_12_plen_51_part_00
MLCFKTSYFNLIQKSSEKTIPDYEHPTKIFVNASIMVHAVVTWSVHEKLK